MAKLRGLLPRTKITITIDQEILSVLSVIKEKSGWNMSVTIEELLLIGLKNSKLGEN
jgi:hypothetical protein